MTEVFEAGEANPLMPVADRGNLSSETVTIDEEMTSYR